ncbi:MULTISPECIES: DUF502 domain-containing protein [Ensifer]|jgi:uncharacterized membrane protein|uniref:DUF502 domain-containing protein n=1 Tax=Ensifer canadensis TaxID=555315 RepID=A0AAW4FAR3_9HYPH|nr:MULTISPECIES: DUF502 domain-containing protein [Ensifer]AHK44336.1 putative transmembrane protein [Ensifer adhaerens OV14]MDP9634507.1 putative membrane protein [Ensifer adhaerens]KQU84171.1 hypothetical protein ASD00_33545 [Ensifer sp. Root31]KQW60788.1 hypothetical protein ASD02_24250 [Ensifer sp. Root1252]KQW75331.1 hypothetical protein ASD03_28095 [Ensifer sp. Root127]
MGENSKSGYIATRLRNYFLTGLIICAPLAITVWLVRTFIEWADGWVKPYLPNFYNPDTYSPVAIPGFGLLVALIVITLVGFLTANLVGRSIVAFGESLVSRTPLVRTIYKSLKQIFQTVLQEQSSSFKKAGLIEYPSPGLWSLVFIATDVKGEVAAKFSERGMDMVTVFLPPTPIPTAGFLLFVPRDKIIPLEMSAEDAAKLLISGGLVAPDYKPLANAPPLQIAQQKSA